FNNLFPPLHSYNRLLIYLSYLCPANTLSVQSRNLSAYCYIYTAHLPRNPDLASQAPFLPVSVRQSYSVQTRKKQHNVNTSLPIKSLPPAPYSKHTPRLTFE